MIDSISTRAGHYVRQAAGYRAFIPKDLPPHPPLRIDDRMVVLLSSADQALGRLDGCAETLPDPDLFVWMYVRKEAVLSSQIEGTQASLLDVLEFEASGLARGRPADVREVINYIAAMRLGLERLRELPLSLRLIRDIHARLLEDVWGGERTPGEFRRSQNWVGPPGSTIHTASYVPPPPHEMAAPLSNLETFLHEPEPMPVLVRVGLAHGQFETIHPFLDGNGRVGRLLITFLLCEKAILRRPLLYLSFYFKERRSEYYERLQAIRDHGDWEGWISFFLRGVQQVSQEATEKAGRIVRMREEHRRLIVERLGRTAGSALTLLEFLFTQPLVSVKQTQEATGLKFPSANRLMGRLKDIGLLREMTGHRRNRLFGYTPYLSLLTDEPAGEHVPA